MDRSLRNLRRILDEHADEAQALARPGSPSFTAADADQTLDLLRGLLERERRRPPASWRRKLLDRLKRLTN